MTELSGPILDGESRPEGPGAEPKPGQSVVTECDLPQPPDKVWQALTVPRLLEAWLPDALESEILEAEPNRLLRYRWPGTAQDKDARGRRLESEVTFELTGTKTGGTHLRVVHRLLPASNVVPFGGRRRKETVAMALRWAA
jgi:uncharacterized protein YndB with AHSA1/START domain